MADLAKSREHWRGEAARAGRRGAELEAKVAELRWRRGGLKKTTTKKGAKTPQINERNGLPLSALTLP